MIRYQERFKYIQDVLKMRVKCSYEDFTQSVIHPLEFGPHSSAPSTMRHSPVKPLVGSSAISVGTATPGTFATSITSFQIPSSPETRWSVSSKVSSLLRLARTKKPMDAEEILGQPRPRNAVETMLPSQLQCKGSLCMQNPISLSGFTQFCMVCISD